MLSESARERFALEVYGSLLAIQEDWGGKLVLCCGDINLWLGIPSAVCVAGGTCLTVGATPAYIKSARNDGIVDFVVNNLSEALRTLKNAVREQRSLSVAIDSEPESILTEILERGVLPDCIVPEESPAQVDPLLSRLLDRGSLLYRPDSGDSKGGLHKWLATRKWVETNGPDDNAPALRAWNEHLLQVLPPDDEMRRRWVRKAPLYFRPARKGIRTLWLSQEEQRQLRD